MKKKIINNFNYYANKEFNSLTYHDEHIPNNPFDPIKDLSYKLIGTKYSSQIPIHHFNLNTNLNSPLQMSKVNDIINEIQLSLISNNNSIDYHHQPNDDSCIKKQENNIIIQEEILRLSMEKNNLLKQYDNLKQLNTYAKNQFNTIKNECNKLDDVNKINSVEILKNEAIIKKLNEELMMYYKFKKQAKENNNYKSKDIISAVLDKRLFNKTLQQQSKVKSKSHIKVQIKTIVK